MALGTPQPSDIKSTLTGPKDSGSGSPGGNNVAPGFNQGRISGMLSMDEQSSGGKGYPTAPDISSARGARMQSQYNDGISGNLGGTTDTGGSDQNPAASFQGITVEPPHLPPGAVPAANEQP